MTCRDCEKRLNPETDFCPKCGLAAQAPTVVESHIEERKKMIEGLGVCVICGVIFLSLVLLTMLYMAYTRLATIPELLEFLPNVILVITIPCFFIGPVFAIFRWWIRKDFPLIKKVADVYEKRKEIVAEGGTNYRITFRFLKGGFLKAKVGRSDYKKCKKGQRVIVKYKVIGKKQKFVYYGVEYFD